MAGNAWHAVRQAVAGPDGFASRPVVFLFRLRQEMAKAGAGIRADVPGEEVRSPAQTSGGKPCLPPPFPSGSSSGRKKTEGEGAGPSRNWSFS